MEQEILINEDEIQQITITSITPQSISMNNISLENIDVIQSENQNVNIEENKNQVIYVDDSGAIVDVTDVLVNGVSVVSDHIAYIDVPTKVSQLINDKGYLTQETDPTVPAYIKQISLNDITNWNNKQNLLVSGTNIKTINNNSILGGGNIQIAEYEAGTGIDITSHVISNTITSYEDLEDLPTIPTKTSQLTNDSNFVIEGDLSEVALSGSYDDLSDKPFIPTETNDLINNSGFIDKDVNDLTYYTLSSSLSTVATTGNYNDLSNTPTIPTVNDATLTIQKNGTNIDSFTANSSTNTTVNITVPTTTSELTNNSGFITSSVNNLQNYTLSSNLSNVATSGDYNDLINKPTIPTLPSLINHTTSMVRNTTYVTSAGYVTCYSYGSICMVSINFQLANNIPGGSTLYSGLPSCQASRFMFSATLGNGSGIRLYIEGDKICNDGAISSGGWIDGLAVYPI